MSVIVNLPTIIGSPFVMDGPKHIGITLVTWPHRCVSMFIHSQALGFLWIAVNQPVGAHIGRNHTRTLIDHHPFFIGYIFAGPGNNGCTIFHVLEASSHIGAHVGVLVVNFSAFNKLKLLMRIVVTFPSFPRDTLLSLSRTRRVEATIL